MKYNYLRWVIVNFTIMATFIFGQYYENNTLITFSLVFLWITVVVGSLLTFISDDIIKTLNYNPSVPYIIDFIFDCFVLGALLYYNYPILAAAHVWTMLQLARVYKIKEQKK